MAGGGLPSTDERNLDGGGDPTAQSSTQAIILWRSCLEVNITAMRRDGDETVIWAVQDRKVWR